MTLPLKFSRLNLKSTQMHSSEIKTRFPLSSRKHIQTLLHVKGLSSDVQDWHLGCQHSNSVDWQIIKTSSQLRTPIRRPKKEVHLPSEMAFMFSKAAWADLNGKKAARLTMLLNFPMLSTLSSTWNTDAVISNLLHPEKRLEQHKRSQEWRPTWGSNMPISSTSLTANSA